MVDRTVMMDFGSGRLKAGFTQDERPIASFSSMVGFPKGNPVLLGLSQKSSYVGPEAQAKRGLMSLVYPIERGIIKDWDSAEKLLLHAYLSELQAAPEENRLIFTEPLLNPKSNREKLCEVLFEKFNVPYLYIAPPQYFSLYATGQHTGTVVDVGAGLTTVVPFIEGLVMPLSVKRLDCAGHDYTNYLMRLINERGWTFNSSSDLELMSDIKEKYGYVTKDLQQELKFSLSSPDEIQKKFTLPDGRILPLIDEHFRVCEAVFRPNLIGCEAVGLHQLLWDAVHKCPIDVRKPLFRDIILTGGSTLFPGVPERLTQELKNIPMISTITTQLSLTCLPGREYLAWQGGAVFGNIFMNENDFWLSAPEYDTSGAARAFFKFM